jgi:hypothetical protein
MLPQILYIEDNKLPSLNDVIEGFKRIEYLNNGDFDYETIKKEYFNNLKFLPNLLSPEGKWGSFLYRASIVDEEKLDITDIDTFSFPKPIYCTSKGRCNLKNFPVFYASIDIDTALREKRKNNDKPLEKGDTVYISYWKLKEHINIKYAQFIFSNNIELGTLIKQLNESNHSKLEILSHCYSNEKQESFKYLNNKLSDFFLSNNYNLSSFISHNILYENSKDAPIKADAILYPSLQAGYNSLNLAIHPDFVINNLELVRVNKINFIEFVNKGAFATLEQVGIPDKSKKIVWNSLFFSFDKSDIVDIEIMFDNEPDENLFSDNDEFYFQNKRELLPNIVWHLIEQNKSKIFSLLSNLSEEPNETMIYQKTLFFELTDKLVVLLQNNTTHKVFCLKITFNYKIKMQPL